MGFPMLWYEENTMRRPSERMIRSTTGTLLKTAAKKVTRGHLSPVHKAVEGIFKYAVNCGAGDNAIRSRLDSVTDSHGFAQNIVGCLMKTTTSTAPISELVKRHAKISVMTKAKFYDPGTNVRKANEDPMSPTPLAGRSSLCQRYPHMTRQRTPKNEKAPPLLGRHAKSAGRASIAQRTKKSTVTIRVQNMSM